MRTFLISAIAVLIVLVPSSGAAFDSRIRTLDGSENTVLHLTGASRNAVPTSRAGPVRGRHREARHRPTHPVGQQSDLQRRLPEPVLGERRHTVGIHLGSVHGPHVRAPTGGRRRERADPASARRTRSRTSRTTSARSPSRARLQRREPDEARRASRSTPSAATSTRGPSTAGRMSGSSGCAKGRSTGGSRTTAPACCCRDGYLPRRDSRGNARRRRRWRSWGGLWATPDRAMVAGDVRANENIALTATHTLFAREHNRIVARCRACSPDEVKFQIARRIVGAEQQYITYNEFLPRSACARAVPGLRPGRERNPSNEFATVGYRAHSMIHGEFESSGQAGTTRPRSSRPFASPGHRGRGRRGRDGLAIPLNVAFGNPDLLQHSASGPCSPGLGGEPSTRTTSRSTTSCGACSSRFRCRATRVSRRARAAGLLPRRARSGSHRYRARP